MWSNLTFDLLVNIFSYLSPDSFARANATCRNWHALTKSAAVSVLPHRHPPWFLAFPARTCSISCYALNPIGENWHVLPLDHISSPIRPIATIGALLLSRVTGEKFLQLGICNPFTKQYRNLPMLNVRRTNPAVGVVDHNSSYNYKGSGFKIYVAGGMSEAASGGAEYQPTIEMYDSHNDKWKIVGQMPVEFAVRLTVWTPNESVYSNGVLYWMTSARAYSVMGFELSTSRWRELGVPIADRLEFAALVPRNGELTLVGGMCGRGMCVWELGQGNAWSVIEKVPFEMVNRVLGNKANWDSVKCVGIDGAVCLYRDLGSGIIVWRKVFDEEIWEWDWIDGCESIRGVKCHNLKIKGLLLHPNLAHCNFFNA